MSDVHNPIVLALIPARGGSKGISRKNVRLLAQKPLIQHTIEHARQARSIQRVVVSTDDAEIADISKRCGAEVVWRPGELSGDAVSSESVLLHALEFLREKEGFRPELTAFLQCTSPLIIPEDIDSTVRALLHEKADSAFSVALAHCFLWKKNSQGMPVGINHDERVRLRRQDREEQYVETGAIYVMRTEEFLKVKYRFFGKITMYVIPPDRALEIDRPVDFHVAEVLLSRRKADKDRSGSRERM